MTEPLTTIEGVIVSVRRKFSDPRGWLAESWRSDEPPIPYTPAMAYISMTLPGQQRGPHEHRHQTDYFVFPGTSDFLVVLWDNRPTSATRGASWSLVARRGEVTAIVIPPGVVHGYKNIGETEGLVVNLPDRLYAGPGKKEPVDEIRHEHDPATPFRFPDALP